MTHLQLIAHQEQVEALRRDFETEWARILLPWLLTINRPKDEQIIATKRIAWLAFLSASKIRRLG